MTNEIEMNSDKQIDQSTPGTNSRDNFNSESQDIESSQPPDKLIPTEVSENETQEEINSTDKSDDDTIEEGEEIITSTMPPKQIIDTIVTTTTNPDGSLKRTTRKTTRTVLTTARIRKVKVKNLPISSESNQSSTCVKFNAEKSDGNSLAQATLAIIPPQTEVIYQENVKPISDMDPDTMAQLKQSPESIALQQAITKTTTRKTVSATAATATFYATGSEAMSPCIFKSNGSVNESTSKNINSMKMSKDPQQSFFLSSIDENNKININEPTREDSTVKERDDNTPMKGNNSESETTITTKTLTTTHGSGSTTTTTTTTTTTNNNKTRKQTTRVTNNFASKRFL
ncbi:hypothetical protein EWB00_001028, partial [Schistosoma japonicum]